MIYDGLMECGKKIVSATKFIDFFVHDLLDYSILNQEDKEFSKDITRFSILDAVNEIKEIVEDKIHLKNIKCEIQMKGFTNNKHKIKTDSKRLQQILLNLLSNAIKFTDRDGSVMILVEYIEKFQNFNQLRISVIDNGIGIKQVNQDKIFQLFGSLKEEKKKYNAKGIGLGLVISKLIVEKFDGYIDFVSTYNQGSNFFYCMKLEDDSSSQSGSSIEGVPSKSESNGESSGLNIMPVAKGNNGGV